MLPLSKYYVHVKYFVDTHNRFEFGKVIHRLCGAIRNFLQKYLTFLTKLEYEFRNGRISIQKLWFCVQSPMIHLKTVYEVLSDISKKDVRGGALLNLLYDRYLALRGDQESRNLVGSLLEEAALPYFDILKGWLHGGLIDDPFSEFMVEEHHHMKKEMLNEDFSDAYWEQRYTLRESHIPEFMCHHKERILSTGKYLNIIKECNAALTDLPTFAGQSLSLNLDQLNHGTHIDAMYDYASRKLLDILKQNFHLNLRLR